MPYTHTLTLTLTLSELSCSSCCGVGSIPLAWKMKEMACRQAESNVSNQHGNYLCPTHIP